MHVALRQQSEQIDEAAQAARGEAPREKPNT
jgi:hypothetical protein